MAKTKSFWVTLPGILTGIAGVITAIGGLLLILYQINVIGPQQREVPGEVPGEMEQERLRLEERVSEIRHQIARLISEIESLQPEAEQNPDIEMAVRDKRRIIHELEREMQDIQEKLSQPPQR